jgi:HD-GYP domain-containing protein (c-di-GMP phosphodiesterase class II)/PAS domain-containing protein
MDLDLESNPNTEIARLRAENEALHQLLKERVWGPLACLSITPLSSVEVNLTEPIRFSLGPPPDEVNEMSLRHVMAGARCLIYHSLAWEDDTGILHWKHHIADSDAAHSFFPVTIPPDGDYLTAWIAGRFPEDQSRMYACAAAALRSGRSYSQEYRCRRADRTVRWLSEYVAVEPIAPRVWKLLTICTDITERKQSEDLLRQMMAEAPCLLWYATVRETGTGCLHWDLTLADEEAAARYLPIDQMPDEPFVEAWYRSRLPEDNVRMYVLAKPAIRAGRDYRQEFRCRMRDGSLRTLVERVHVETLGEGTWRAVGVCIDVTERKQQEEALYSVMSGAHCLLWYAEVYETPDGKIEWQGHVADEAAAQRFFQVEVPEGRDYYYAWYWTRLEEDRQASDLHGREAFRAGHSYSQEFRCRRADGAIRWLSEYVTVETNGPRHWSLVGVCTDITERHEVEERVNRQFERLETLYAIETMIATNPDSRPTLKYLLLQALRLLHMDAGDILLYDPSARTFHCAAEAGFRRSLQTPGPLSIDQGRARTVLRERKTIYHTAPGAPPTAGYDDPLFAREGFASYLAVPLLSKGEVLGLLELFGRSPREIDPEWRQFAETLGGQAATAINNARMVADLQQTNAELLCAYDATIEGWARVLELRDKETEGHSQRVTEMTCRLAQALGVGDPDLSYIRYGALLHDIGKMGVPDSILHKPGPLNEAEWAVMRKHPEYAHRILSPIAFLKPALDIPYCHHERWNGSGYPRGLKGGEIPLAARIFAVVDVWDALRSARPYRAALPEAEVFAEIRAAAGTHLDPHVVEVFLNEVCRTASGVAPDPYALSSRSGRASRGGLAGRDRDRTEDQV